jgi:predicted ATPase
MSETAKGSETGLYLKSVTFTKAHRDFKEGDRFEFRQGINFLVGDQGAGKSTLIAEVRKHLMRKGRARSTIDDRFTSVETDAPGVAVLARDFEKENVRVVPSFGMVDGFDDAAHVMAMYASHGEVVRMQIRGLQSLGDTPLLLLLDEPDGALSLRSICELRDTFIQLVSRRVQIVAAVHHPWLIEAVPEVLSLEHRGWMASTSFIEAMKQPRPAVSSPTSTKKRRT